MRYSTGGESLGSSPAGPRLTGHSVPHSPPMTRRMQGGAIERPSLTPREGVTDHPGQPGCVSRPQGHLFSDIYLDRALGLPEV